MFRDKTADERKNDVLYNRHTLTVKSRHRKRPATTFKRNEKLDSEWHVRPKREFKKRNVSQQLRKCINEVAWKAASRLRSCTGKENRNVAGNDLNDRKPIRRTRFSGPDGCRVKTTGKSRRVWSGD